MKIKLFGKPTEGKTTAYPTAINANSARELSELSRAKRIQYAVELIISYAMKDIREEAEKGNYLTAFNCIEVCSGYKTRFYSEEIMEAIKLAKEKLETYGYTCSSGFSYGSLRVSWKGEENDKG